MIIQSLLDQDFYKFTMAQVVLHRFPDFMVKYKFKCRSKDVVWTPKMIQEIKLEIFNYCKLQFTEDELAYLKRIRFIKPYFVDFLRLYKPDFQYIKVWCDGELHIEVEGPWFLTIQFEMPILSIVNEVYFRNIDVSANHLKGIVKLLDKIEIAKKYNLRFSEFGTRRRYSFAWHDDVVKTLASDLNPSIFTGTSNVYFAKKYNLTPIGTMAHELIQIGQALDNVTLANSQKTIFQIWVDEYRGDLGIVLSDTLGTDKFLKDFDLYFAKLYDGIRHDSGDPVNWADQMIEHYRKLKIDPKTKTLVFSDGIDFDKAVLISEKFKDKTNVVFGIGTNLTNDFENITPLQIVMKIVECNGKPVAKLSDNPSKTMCDNQDFLNYLRLVIK